VTRDPHHERPVPGGDHQVGIGEHPGHPVPLPHRAALAESGVDVELDHLVEIDVVPGPVGDHVLDRRMAW
jgi:hypothetical protein